MTQKVKTALIGIGHVGRNFLRILEIKRTRLAEEQNLDFVVVCVADSSGTALIPQGIDPAFVRQLKEEGGRVSDMEAFMPGLTPAAAIADIDCELVLDASPVNLTSGEPGLSVARAALGRGIGVVLANKAPLVLAFDELHRLAEANGAGMAFSATVCGALPVINIGRRDLVAADITLLRGIFNSTSNYVLAQMAHGYAYKGALDEARERGIAETDSSLDVEGWDTANKLVIIANSVLGMHATLEDVSVEGIVGIEREHLLQEQAHGRTIKLLAQAELTAEGYRLSVGPIALPTESFLGSCEGWEMGIEIQSDLYGKMYHKIWEREPLPTAAAMLRDSVWLFR